MNKIKNNFKLIKELSNKKAIFYIVISCILLILYSISQPLISYLYKIIIDNFTSDITFVFMLIAVYILVQLCSDIFELLKNYFEIHINYIINNNLIVILNNKIKNIKLEELEDAKLYDYIDRVYKNIANAATSFISIVLGLLSPIMIIIGYFIAVVKIKWYFPLIIIITSFPYFCMSLMRIKLNYNQEVELNKKTRQLEYFIDIMTNRKYVKEIRLFNLIDYLNKKIIVLREFIVKKRISLSIKFSLYGLLLSILRNIALCICLYITCINNSEKVGSIILVIGAIQSIVNNVILLIEQISSIKQYNLYINDWEVFKNLPNCKTVVQKKISDYTIHINNVSFRYPNSDTFTLEHINMTIKTNQKVAIVGANGSGKSTLINLILGLFEPTDGDICIGKDSLTEVISDFRNITVPVFQKFIRYQLTLDDNLKAGNFGKEINYNIIKNLDFQEFVENLSDGLNTNLGQMDVKSCELSGGEWQKIAILRALARPNSKILIMDEPTASLDPISENNIYENITNISDRKTLILISHRLSAAKLCNEIYVLDKGKIVEHGSHKQLMDLKGKYYKMYLTQSELYI